MGTTDPTLPGRDTREIDDATLDNAFASLPKVDAPSDFEFRLKARLANKTPAKEIRHRPVWAVVYAVPVIVAVGLGAIFLTRDGSNGPGVQLATAPANASEPALSAASNSNARPSDVTPERETADVADSRSAANSRRVQQPQNTGNETLGGSFDSAIESSKPILPRGFDTNAAVPRSVPPASTNRSLDTAQLLKILGVDAVFDRSGWKVRSVSANSIAQRSDIRVGDVIESIDRENSGDQAAFNIKQLNISRDGRPMQILLRPQ